MLSIGQSEYQRFNGTCGILSTDLQVPSALNFTIVKNRLTDEIRFNNIEAEKERNELKDTYAFFGLEIVMRETYKRRGLYQGIYYLALNNGIDPNILEYLFNSLLPVNYGYIKDIVDICKDHDAYYIIDKISKEPGRTISNAVLSKLRDNTRNNINKALLLFGVDDEIINTVSRSKIDENVLHGLQIYSDKSSNTKINNDIFNMMPNFISNESRIILSCILKDKIEVDRICTYENLNTVSSIKNMADNYQNTKKLVIASLIIRKKFGKLYGLDLLIDCAGRSEKRIVEMLDKFDFKIYKHLKSLGMHHYAFNAACTLSQDGRQFILSFNNMTSAHEYLSVLDFNLLEDNTRKKFLLDNYAKYSPAMMSWILSNFNGEFKHDMTKQEIKKVMSTSKFAHVIRKYKYEYPMLKNANFKCLLKDNPINVDNITIRLLDANDPLQIIVGDLTNCCQRIGGMGEFCVIEGLINPYSGFVVFERNEQVIAQAWVWLTADKQTLVLDNIEFANNREISQFVKPLREWVKQSPYKNIQMGLGYNEITGNVGYDRFDVKEGKYKNPKQWTKFLTHKMNKQYFVTSVYTDADRRTWLKKDGIIWDNIMTEKMARDILSIPKPERNLFLFHREEKKEEEIDPVRLRCTKIRYGYLYCLRYISVNWPQMCRIDVLDMLKTSDHIALIVSDIKPNIINKIEEFVPVVVMNASFSVPISKIKADQYGNLALPAKDAVTLELSNSAQDRLRPIRQMMLGNSYYGTCVHSVPRDRVQYMSHYDFDGDSLVISESFADRLRSLEVSTERQNPRLIRDYTPSFFDIESYQPSTRYVPSGRAIDYQSRMIIEHGRPARVCQRVHVIDSMRHLYEYSPMIHALQSPRSHRAPWILNDPFKWLSLMEKMRIARERLKAQTLSQQRRFNKIFDFARGFIYKKLNMIPKFNFKEICTLPKHPVKILTTCNFDLV